MSRIKRGTTSLKRRKNILSMVKGFRWRRKSSETLARQALIKAGAYAYRDRRTKKRTMRRLWILRFNNALKALDVRYSSFINAMKKKNVVLDRKILAQIAVERPALLAKIVDAIKK